MDELKACPFCGEVLIGQKDLFLGGVIWTHKNDCVKKLTMAQPADDFEKCWNTRPIEDKLQADLTSLRTNLKEARDEMIDFMYTVASITPTIEAKTMSKALDILRAHHLIEDN